MELRKCNGQDQKFKLSYIVSIRLKLVGFAEWAGEMKP